MGRGGGVTRSGKLLRDAFFAFIREKFLTFKRLRKRGFLPGTPFETFSGI